MAEAIADVYQKSFKTPSELRGSPNYCVVSAVRSVISATRGIIPDEKTIAVLVDQSQTGATAFGAAFALQQFEISCRVFISYEVDANLRSQAVINMAKAVASLTTIRHVYNHELKDLFGENQALIVWVCSEELFYALTLERLGVHKAREYTEIKNGGHHAIVVTKILEDGTILTSEDAPLDTFSSNVFRYARCHCESTVILVDLVCDASQQDSN